MGEALLAVLARIEAGSHTELCAPWIGTKRNQFPDWGSGRFAPDARCAADIRAKLGELDELLRKKYPGFRRVDLDDTAEFYFRQCVLRRAVDLHDEQPEVVAARAAQRAARSAPQRPDAASRLLFIEGCAGSGQVSAAVTELGICVAAAFENNAHARAAYTKRLRSGADAGCDDA